MNKTSHFEHIKQWEVMSMSKNNKKTMNERTNNSFETYKNNKNSNSNNNDPKNILKGEFAADFEPKDDNKNQQAKKNK